MATLSKNLVIDLLKALPRYDRSVLLWEEGDGYYTTEVDDNFDPDGDWIKVKDLENLIIRLEAV